MLYPVLAVKAACVQLPPVYIANLPQARANKFPRVSTQIDLLKMTMLVHVIRKIAPVPVGCFVMLIPPLKNVFYHYVRSPTGLMPMPDPAFVGIQIAQHPLDCIVSLLVAHASLFLLASIRMVVLKTRMTVSKK